MDTLRYPDMNFSSVQHFTKICTHLAQGTLQSKIYTYSCYRSTRSIQISCLLQLFNEHVDHHSLHTTNTNKFNNRYAPTAVSCYLVSQELISQLKSKSIRLIKEIHYYFAYVYQYSVVLLYSTD